MKKSPVAVAGVAAVLLLTAGSCDEDKDRALRADEQSTATQLDRYQKNQPVPSFDWSQQRETLIAVLQAQVHGQATTTFNFLEGLPNPIAQCPSIGFPVPSTAQLTNPSQVQWGANGAAGEVGLMEPNGVYTGESTGTYVVCVTPQGMKYVDYWEGYVKVVGGPAHWEPGGKGIVLDGAPTVGVKTK